MSVDYAKIGLYQAGLGNGIEEMAEILHRGGIQLAVLLGQADDLVAGELDGTRLMTGHMAGGGGDDASQRRSVEAMTMELAGCRRR
mgnify:CR=1 FL=1